MPTAVLLEQFDDQQLVVRYGELRDGIHRAHVAFPLRHQHLVVAAHRIDHPLLNGGALRHFLVHDLEPDKVRPESHVRPVPRFRVEIEQPVVRVDGFQEELHPEAFAAQVPDLPPVLLVDALHDQLHQERAFACQFPEMEVHAGMRKVRRVPVLQKILHLDVQHLRLMRIPGIERVEAPVLADDGKVRFPRKPLGRRLHPDHVLRTVRFPGDNPVASQIHVPHRRGEDDMHRLGERHLHPVGRNHLPVG